MENPNLEKVLQLVKELTLQERQQLLRILDDLVVAKPGMSKEEQLRQALINRGILEDFPRLEKDLE